MRRGLLNQNVDNPLVSSGFIFMVLSAASFCMMTVFVKMAGETLPTIQIVFVRGLFTLALTWVFIYRKKLKPFGKHKKLLAARGLAGTIALFLVYESINRFPLSEATVIQYLYPLFTAVFAVLLLSEPITKNIIIGLCSGFFGVYCLLGFPIVSQNSIDIISLILAVSGSILTGLAYVLVKKATNLNEHPLVVMFFFPLFTVPVFFPFIFSKSNAALIIFSITHSDLYIFISRAAFIIFAFQGYVIWYLGLTMAVAQIAGAYTGSKFAIKNGEKVVRPVLVIVSILLSLRILLG